MLLVWPVGVAAQQREEADTKKPGGEEAIAKQIRMQIPAVTAISAKTFRVIAQAAAMPKMSAFRNQSVTAVLMFSSPKDAEAAGKHFRSLKRGLAKPAELAEEIYRTVGVGKLRVRVAPCTLIHAERITDFTCKVSGEIATGSVSFRVPDLYEGKIDYVARRKGTAWQIEEFKLPGYGKNVVRDATGLWKVKELKPQGN